MKVTVKLFALLGRYLPAGALDNAAELDVDEGATPVEVIRRLNVPEAHCHLVLINGHFVPPGERGTVRLNGNDVLAIWPPVAGG
ncbi:MAG: MoaD/ThiS family protein [Rhodospirillales bacterium]|nr:MoaD/ThiS family protein [Rhodospirillales bacterium]